MNEVRFTIPGDPIPLARPRLGKYGVFDCQSSLKRSIATCIRFQLKDEVLLEGPLQFVVTFYFKRPKSSKKSLHDVRPDLDNLIKFYLDVCNGLIYADDKQISIISAVKMYHGHPRLEPKTDIKITKLPH